MEFDLPPGYAVEMDAISHDEWDRLLTAFSDASIYQTQAYEAARSTPATVSHFVLRKGGHVIAAAQARIAKIPFIPLGVAYVRWGPMWRRRETEPDPRIFAIAMRAMRNEYVLRRGLLLRILPYAFDEDRERMRAILDRERFARVSSEPAQQTLVMRIDRPLHELRQGLQQKWRNCLNRAERNSIDIEISRGPELFPTFAAIYADMYARKRFAGASDVNQFRRAAALLQDDARLWIAIARYRGEPAAGVVVSKIGDSGLFLLGATASVGMESKASYLLQWRALEWLQEGGARFYNLHGINPATNPGTYHFKVGLCGKNGSTAHYLGAHDFVGGRPMPRLAQSVLYGRRSLRNWSAALPADRGQRA